MQSRRGNADGGFAVRDTSAEDFFRTISLDDLQQDQYGANYPAKLSKFERLQSLEPPTPTQDMPVMRAEPFKFAGYLGTIMASLFASLSVLCIKLLPVEDTIQEMSKASMYRGLLLMLFFGVTTLITRDGFLGPKSEYTINFLRAILGALSTLMVYVAIEFITIGECSALVFSSPVWTCILGFMILKEPLPISLFLAIPMSFVGIVLLADPDLLIFISNEIFAGTWMQQTPTRQPPTIQRNRTDVFTASYQQRNQTTTATGVLSPTWALSDYHHSQPTTDPYSDRLVGIFIALVASIFMSGVIISFRYRNTTPIATCSFQYGLALALVAASVQAVVGFGALPKSGLEWFLLFGIGVSSYCCQCLFQWSLQYVPAGNFSVMRSLDIVLGFVLGAVFLNDVVLWTSVAGSVLIMIVVAMLMLNDYIKTGLKALCRICGCCRG